jgi:hypothetical protein
VSSVVRYVCIACGTDSRLAVRWSAQRPAEVTVYFMCHSRGDLTLRTLLCSLIDFNFSRPSGSDLGRYRNVLFNAKGRNQPVEAK